LSPADTQSEQAQAPRQLPGLDDENRAFWTGGADGKLMIMRCEDCDTWLHPPRPRCPACHGSKVAPAPVSGRAKVASFTINHQAWMPGMKDPFVFAAVELEEQAELYVLTNIVGCPVDAVTIGMPVEVTFLHQDDIYLPLFQPRTGA
jgi:uncharacterized OB-fold protein